MSSQRQKISRTTGEWSKIIEQWRISELSARAWCRQHDITYSTFMYWRQRLQQQNVSQNEIQPLPSSPFIEIKDSTIVDSGVSVLCQGVQIDLCRDFDRSVFLSCVKTLQGDVCYR